MVKRQPRNTFEQKLWDVLKKTKRAKYEPYTLPYTLENKYLPDFELLPKKGVRRIIIEGKGKFTGMDRRKMLRVKQAHPDLDIRFVFYRAANKLYKGSKTTYGDWATDHGFLWADKKIPTSWLRE